MGFRAFMQSVLNRAAFRHFLSFVDVNKDQPKEKSKGYLFRADSSTGGSTVALCWRRLSGGRGVGTLYSGKEGSWWPGQPLVTGDGAYLVSLAGPKLETGTKIRETVSYESGPDHLGLIVTEVVV